VRQIGTRILFYFFTIAIIYAADSTMTMPVFFFRNVDAVDSESSFIMETPRVKALFRNDAVLYTIHGVRTELRFPGANQNVLLESREPMTSKVNWLVGNRSEWKTDVATYRQLIYRELYPGIDLTFAGANGEPKAEFIVHAHADPSCIRLHYPNATRVSIDSNGDLVVADPAGKLRERKPTLYQDTTEGRAAIEGAYRILDDRTAAFTIGPYNPDLVLVIDPVVSYATYFGGGMTGAVTGVATDGSGSVYVTGWTEAIDFPIAGPIQATNHGGVDAFVAKFSAAGTSLLYATYIGGSGDDRGAAIAVDSSGQAYVTGSTSSVNFPLASPVRSALGGGRDAFVLKLNASGSGLVYCTLLGGSGWDQGTAIAVDASGNAYIAGDTQSPDFRAVGAVQPAFGGQTDAFVTKLSAGGALVYSTFLGGSGAEHAAGIAVDSGGNTYVAGGTYSTDFPVTANSFQHANAGGQDAFAAKLNPAGSALVYSTYLGGSGGTQIMSEQANAIAIDSSGNAYLAGVTSSANFPVTTGAIRTTVNGLQDAFITKLNSSGTALVYSTYLGGSTSNWATGVAVDSSGDAYVTGTTSSVDFPQVSSLQGFAGLYDGFVSKANPSGTGLVYSTLYGGSGSDSANAIALDGNGAVYIGGQTSSPDLPLHSAIRSAYIGFATGWVLSLAGNTAATPPPPPPSPPSGTNLALGKTASQSSTLAPASLAVDGNADGVFFDNSVTHTNLDANAWWQVDLQGNATITSVVVWGRTDCCASRLSDYWVFVSNTPFSAADSPATLQNRPGTYSSHQTAAPSPSTTIAFSNVQGRYVRVQLSGTNYLSLAEVQVFGTVNVASSNLAAGKPATQSSTLAPASRAVDGNTDGLFFDSSVTHTNLDANAWWQVDLQSSATINSVTVWGRTDCCSDRLTDYWIFISNTPFSASDTPATLQSRAGTLGSHQTSAPNPSTTIALNGVQGRYVRIQLSGTNYLSLAELQVFGTTAAPAPPPATNLALGKPATESSTLAAASLAVDGNTDGAFFDNSVTHTNLDGNAWWQVDLQSSSVVNTVVVWGRTDCCSDRLGDYWVFVSNTPFSASDTPATLQNRAGTYGSHQTSAPNPSTAIPFNGVQGRYVRVQLSGTNYLSLAELQVF
jgi:hypothetical protein